MNGVLRLASLFTPALAVLALGAGPSAAADLPVQQPQTIEPAASSSGWTFTFTPYLWMPWLSGNATVKGRDFNVQADPSDVFGYLKFGVMGNVEARKGPFSLEVDGFYANVGASPSILRSTDYGTVGASLSSSATLAAVELTGGYEAMRWGSGGLKDSSGSYTALDVLAGGRYWQQSLDVNLNLTGPAGGSAAFAHSGFVEWTDPFIGARIRHQLAPGQELALRGDVGGFDVGSKFSWQALATYNRHLFDFSGIPVDSYLGFRALSVDYTQGSGRDRYAYDVVQYGPVMGLTAHFPANASETSQAAVAGGLKDDAVSAAPSWAGYYLGVNGGGGWGDSNSLIFTDTVPGTGDAGTFQRKGGFGGIEIGNNWQGGSALGNSWVLGMEADFQASEINNRFARTESYFGQTFFKAKQGIDYFGTARARIGYALGNALIYGTGGIAYGNVITKIRLNNLSGQGFTNSLRDVETEPGYAVGGGAEYIFAPGWSAKLEYQYIDLGEQNLNNVASDGAVDRTKVDNNFSTLRFGLNYHLPNNEAPLK